MFFIHFASKPGHAAISPSMRRILRKGSQTYHAIAELGTKQQRRSISHEERKVLEKHYETIIGVQTAMQPYRTAIARDLAARLRKAIASIGAHQPQFHRTFKLESSAKLFAAHLEGAPTSYHIVSRYGGIRALESLARVARQRKLRGNEAQGVNRIISHLADAIRKSESE